MKSDFDALVLDFDHAKDQHSTEIDTLKQELQLYTQKLKSSSEEQVVIQGLLVNVSVELEALQKANHQVTQPRTFLFAWINFLSFFLSFV